MYSTRPTSRRAAEAALRNVPVLRDLKISWAKSFPGCPRKFELLSLMNVRWNTFGIGVRGFIPSAVTRDGYKIGGGPRLPACGREWFDDPVQRVVHRVLLSGYVFRDDSFGDYFPGRIFLRTVNDGPFAELSKRVGGFLVLSTLVEQPTRNVWGISEERTFFRAKRVILVENPRSIRRDNTGQLHNVDGPAVSWRDGAKWHFVHGNPVPHDLFEKYLKFRRSKLTGDGLSALSALLFVIHKAGLQGRIEGLADAFYSVVGYGRLLTNFCSCVQKDSYGELWSFDPRTVNREFYRIPQLRCVRVWDSTHSREQHWLRVPPGIDSAHAAVAWTFRIRPRDYTPVVST